MSLFKDKTLLITGTTGSFGNAVLNRFLRATIDEFNSDNMRRLNLKETKAKIANLEYIQHELNGVPNVVK